MGLFDFLTGKKKELEGPDPLHDLTLAKMKVGYLVDYDLKTWQVTERHRYDYDGDRSDEWELTAGSEVCYLERTEDDEVEWALSRKMPIGAIDGDVRRHIIDHDDPPAKIVYRGTTYYLEASGPAYFYKDGKGSAEGFVYWEFIDEDDENFVNIEQWGETEFEASAGRWVEEYQFSHILPGGPSAP